MASTALTAAVVRTFGLVLRARRDVALAEEVAHLLAQPRIGDGREPRLLLIGAQVRRTRQAFDHRVIEPRGHREHRVPPHREVHRRRRTGEAGRPIGALGGGDRGRRRCRIDQRRRRCVAEGRRIERCQRGRLAGQHHHQQRDEEFQLHAPQREPGDRAELPAFGRFAPVVDEDTQERQEHDAGADQHIPEDAIEGPAEQGGEEFEIAVDAHALLPCSRAST